MRKEYVIYKRQLKTEKKFYVKFWDFDGYGYKNHASVGSIKMQLGSKALHIPHTSKAGAEAIIKMWLKEGSPIASRDLFADYLLNFWRDDSDYVKSKKLRGKTFSVTYLKNHISGIKNYIIPYLESKKLQKLLISQVKPSHLEHLLTHLSETTQVSNNKIRSSEKLSHYRINAIYLSITVPLSEAERLGKISSNPSKNVKKLSSVKAERKILTPAEVKSFFSFPIVDDLRFFAINLLAATTGMRLGECRGLQKENLHDGWIDINEKTNWQDGEGLKDPKYGSIRAVPLPEKTYNVLIQLSDLNPWDNQFIFYGNKKNAPMSKTSIEKYYKETIEKIGISEEERKERKLTFHAWRHFFNTTLRGNIPEHALRALTGHKSEEMTDRYSSVTDEQRTAIAQLADKII